MAVDIVSQPPIDDRAMEAPVPTNLLAGDLALLRKLVDRGLRELQVVYQVVNCEHCAGRGDVAAVRFRPNSSDARFLT